MDTGPDGNKCLEGRWGTLSCLSENLGSRRHEPPLDGFRPTDEMSSKSETITAMHRDMDARGPASNRRDGAALSGLYRPRWQRSCIGLRLVGGESRRDLVVGRG